MSDDCAISRMHTAEHLLSAVMRDEFGCTAPVETHLGDRKSKCDYRVARPLSDGDIQRIESAINQLIASDRRVSCYELARDDADGLFDLTRVPGGLETVRIVSIDGVDETPCIGRHAERTSQLGRFTVGSHEMRSADVVRIRFHLAGPSTGG